MNKIKSSQLELVLGISIVILVSRTAVAIVIPAITIGIKIMAIMKTSIRLVMMDNLKLYSKVMHIKLVTISLIMDTTKKITIMLTIQCQPLAMETMATPTTNTKHTEKHNMIHTLKKIMIVMAKHNMTHMGEQNTWHMANLAVIHMVKQIMIHMVKQIMKVQVVLTKVHHMKVSAREQHISANHQTQSKQKYKAQQIIMLVRIHSETNKMPHQTINHSSLNIHHRTKTKVKDNKNMEAMLINMILMTIIIKHRMELADLD